MFANLMLTNNGISLKNMYRLREMIDTFRSMELYDDTKSSRFFTVFLPGNICQCSLYNGHDFIKVFDVEINFTFSLN